ncbi:MAG: hypothetical protein ACTSSA_15625, partial [Candidatus Freyarchaeota archaeon]
LDAGSYTLTITASRQNHQTQTASVTLTVSGTPTILDTPTAFAGVWSGNVTVWAVFNRTFPGVEPLTDATLTWVIQGTGLSGGLTHVGGGNYTAQINTASLNAESYTLKITATKPNFETQTASVTLTVSSAPTTLNTPTTLTGNWGENITVWAVFNRTFPSVEPLTDATLTWVIQGTGLSGGLTHVGGGNYTAQINTTSLNATSYTLTVSATRQNYQSREGSVTLVVSGTPTALDTLTAGFEGSWGENITIWAVYTRTDPGVEPITDANLTWTIQGTALSGVMTHVGGGNYTAQIDTSLLTAKSYTIVITANRQSFQMQQKGVTLVVTSTPTTLANPLLVPQLPSSPILYAGPLVQVENSVPLTPIIFQYHSLGPNSPLSGANVTLTLGPLSFTMTEVLPGVYVALVPTFGLTPGSYAGVISATKQNYAAQQSQVFLSVKERAVPIPLLNTRVPLSTLLTYLGILAVATPSVGFVAYTIVKRARVPRIIKRIDELIVKISRGEKVDVHLIPRDSVIQKIMREEISIVGVEPRVAEYVPRELADFIVPLLVESGMRENEAYALASVGVPGELSEMIMQTIEEYEEMQAPPLEKEQKQPAPEDQETETRTQEKDLETEAKETKAKAETKTEESKEAETVSEAEEREEPSSNAAGEGNPESENGEEEPKPKKAATPKKREKTKKKKHKKMKDVS